MKRNPVLPLEIILMVIERTYAIDRRRTKTTAYPASHPITRTLFACLTVCKSTTSVAQAQLYRRSLYIDSPQRLFSLVRSYDEANTTASTEGKIDRRTKISHSTSLFLSPFGQDTTDDNDVVANVGQLLYTLAHSLQTLAMSLPIRSGGFRLQDACSSLQVIERFALIRDERFFTKLSYSSLEAPVWSTPPWDRLRHLALFTTCIDQAFTTSIQNLPSIRCLYLVCPENARHALDSFLATASPNLSVTVIDTENRFRHQYHGWPRKVGSRHARGLKQKFEGHREIDGRQDSEPTLSFVFVEPAPKNGLYLEAGQNWMRDQALSGCLWNEET